MHIAVIEI